MINNLKSKIALALPTFLCLGINQSQAQSSVTGQVIDIKTITTAVPFLRINADARSGGMADIGLATTPDVNDMYWNIGKLASNSKNMGASLTYTPWLRDLVPDINLVYLAGFKKFGPDNNQAVGASIRYFNLGDIDYKDINAQSLGTGKPREYSIDGGYSRKLGKNASLGLAARYVYSNLASGPAATQGGAFKPGNGFGVDLGYYFSKELKRGGVEKGDKLAFGAAITNLGTKISYNSKDRYNMPTNLGIGGSYTYKIDEFNSISANMDVNKLLVPSPTQYFDTVNGIAIPKLDPHNDLSVINGLFKSFGDADGGGSEEFKELTWGLGTEYSYQNQFFARAGYFYENKNKGNRQFATVGAGFKYNVFTLQMSYLIPSGSGIARNPLSNTLRFSMLFDFEKTAKKKATSTDDDDE
jgi:hypothetical protein